MAKSARRMRHSARRMHRGGAAELSPASMDGMAAGPAGDAMTEQGLAAEAALVADNQMPAADWKEKSMEELGFGADDAGPPVAASKVSQAPPSWWQEALPQDP